MTHLTPAEIVDAAEGTIPPDRRAHVEQCPRCRDQVQEAIAVLSEVRGVEVHEPSPLFWDRLSARVRERIDQNPARVGYLRQWMWAPAGLLAASLAIVIGFSGGRMPQQSGSSPPTLTPSSGDLSLEQSDDDSTWALVSEATDDIGWEDAEAAGFVVRPGTTERAAMQLPDDEREELARLLQDEMARVKS